MDDIPSFFFKKKFTPISNQLAIRQTKELYMKKVPMLSLIIILLSLLYCDENDANDAKILYYK